MKRYFCAVILALLFPLFCFAQNDFHFSVSPHISILYGELSEILYGFDDEIVSQLDWEQKPLINLGLSSTAAIKNFLISADFDYSLPLANSYMYDSDWENGEKYSFTKHPLTKQQNIDTSLSFAYKISIPFKLFVIPVIQFNYLYSDFEAGNGSGNRHGRNIRVYGVDYKRHSFYIFTGLSVNAQPLSKLTFQIDFLAAPWLYQESLDYHHGVKHPFSTKDIQTGVFTKFKTSLTAEVFLNKTLALQVFTNLLFGFTDKGVLYSDYYTCEMQLIKGQKSGAAIYYIKTGFATKFSF